VFWVEELSSVCAAEIAIAKSPSAKRTLPVHQSFSEESSWCCIQGLDRQRARRGSEFSPPSPIQTRKELSLMSIVNTGAPKSNSGLRGSSPLPLLVLAIRTALPASSTRRARRAQSSQHRRRVRGRPTLRCLLDPARAGWQWTAPAMRTSREGLAVLSPTLPFSAFIDVPPGTILPAR